MNKIIKYCIIGSLICIAVFTAYVKWVEIENKKPTIYIDNYSGSAVEVKYRNNKWVELNDKSSSIKNDLKQGTYFLHIKNLNSALIDTIRIDIKEKKNYIVNISNAMSYFEGEISYQKTPTLGNNDLAKENKINKYFFQTKADFILEKPSNQIEIWSKNKSPQHFNARATKKYIRRANQNW